MKFFEIFYFLHFFQKKLLTRQKFLLLFAHSFIQDMYYERSNYFIPANASQTYPEEQLKRFHNALEQLTAERLSKTDCIIIDTNALMNNKSMHAFLQRFDPLLKHCEVLILPRTIGELRRLALDRNARKSGEAKIGLELAKELGANLNTYEEGIADLEIYRAAFRGCYQKNQIIITSDLTLTEDIYSATAMSKSARHSRTTLCLELTDDGYLTQVPKSLLNLPKACQFILPSWPLLSQKTYRAQHPTLLSKKMTPMPHCNYMQKCFTKARVVTDQTGLKMVQASPHLVRECKKWDFHIYIPNTLLLDPSLRIFVKENSEVIRIISNPYEMTDSDALLSALFTSNIEEVEKIVYLGTEKRYAELQRREPHFMHFPQFWGIRIGNNSKLIALRQKTETLPIAA